MLAGIGLLAVLACVSTAFGLAGWVLRPVTELDAATHEIAEGAAPPGSGPGSARPSCAGSATSFNDMVDAVSDVMDRQRAFVAHASHQLRNPLTALRLRVEELGPSLTDPDGRAEHRLALEETDRLATVLDALLTLARAEREENQRVTVDAAAAAASRVAAWLPLARHRAVALRLDPGEAPAYARTVPTAIDQALDALIDNAVKFSGAGGEVTVTVRPGRRRDGADRAGHRPRHDGQPARPGHRAVLAGAGRAERGRRGAGADHRRGARRRVRRPAHHAPGRAARAGRRAVVPGAARRTGRPRRGSPAAPERHGEPVGRWPGQGLVSRYHCAAPGCSGSGVVTIADRGLIRPAAGCAAANSSRRSISSRVTSRTSALGQVGVDDQVVRVRHRADRVRLVDRAGNVPGHVDLPVRAAQRLGPVAQVDHPQGGPLGQFGDAAHRQAAGEEERVDPALAQRGHRVVQPQVLLADPVAAELRHRRAAGWR